MSFFHCYVDHPDLHSFPTRRSSDLDFAYTPGSPDTGTPVLSALAHCPAWSEPYGDSFAASNTSIECADGSEQRMLLRSEEHTSELQSRRDLVCRLLLEKKKHKKKKD